MRCAAPASDAPWSGCAVRSWSRKARCTSRRDGTALAGRSASFCSAHDTGSPIYGMPILDVDKAATCLFVKRSLASGYAGIDNTLFYKPNTMMLFADAKKMVENIVKNLD